MQLFVLTGVSFWCLLPCVLVCWCRGLLGAWPVTLELDDMGVTGQMQNKGLEVTSEDLF